MRVALHSSGAAVARHVGASPILWIAGMVVAVLALPPAIYAALVHYRFDYVSPSGFIPYEEAMAAVSALDPRAIWAAPLLSVNMSSGDILSNMYTLTIGQAALSLLLGTIMGLALFRHAQLRRSCMLKARGGASAAAGSGLFATVAASSTGLMGCCGSSASIGGGIVALAGIGSLTAAELAAISPYVQSGMIGVFAGLERLWAKRIADAGIQE